MALISIGEVARLLQRDPKAIRNAVANGRITRRPDGYFDSETVRQEWDAATMHERGRAGRPPNKVVDINTPLPPVPPPPDEEPTAERSTRSTDYAKARAASQIYDARLKKLRYEERAASLVPARDVEDAAHKALRCIRDACLSIPSRVAAQIASETSVEKIYQILDREISAVFQDFAEGKIA
jgi:hypothetical protein